MDDVTLPRDPNQPQAAPAVPVAGATPDSAGGEGRSGTFGRDLSGATLGDYRLVRKIAEGGMGEVYEAIQLNLDRRVALKLVTDRFASQSQFLVRFEREAKAAAALNHPNIVQVYDFGKAEGLFYLVMEFVDGVDLAEYVKGRGKLSVTEALGFIEQAARGLNAAAAQAIIHRDVKPANLLLTNDGIVKVSDLGLAKKLTDESEVTMTSACLGSPHFLAPEQAADARRVDHRADIYSLGITLLFLLTGKHPFDGGSALTVLLAHAQKPLPTGAELGVALPDAVESLIRRMSAKNPEDRYQDYASLFADVARVKAGFEPAEKFAATPAANQRRHKLKVALASVAGVAVAGALISMFWPKPPLPANQPQQSAPVDRRFDGGQPFGRRPGPDQFDDPPGFQGGKEGPPGRRPMRLPFPPPPQKEFNPLPDGPIPAMIAMADRYAATNAQECVKIIDRYFQIQHKAAGTQWEEEIDRKLSLAIEAHKKATQEIINNLQARMTRFLRENKPQDAFDVWREFPTRLRTPEADQQIGQILQRELPPEFQPN